MNKEQLIATLQACYFGDKGAYNLILEKYQKLQQENKELHNKIDKAIEYIKRYVFMDLPQLIKLVEILKDSDVDD